MFGLGVARLHFTDGRSESLPPSGITVIVGPNNSGKSVLLTEINQAIVHGGVRNQRWLNSVEIAREGNRDDFEEWFKNAARVVPVGFANAGQLVLWENQPMVGQMMTHAQALATWEGNGALGNTLASRLVAYFDAGSRAQVLGSASARDPNMPAIHPLHQVWDDRQLEDRLSSLVNRAFGFPVTINRYSQTLELLMGEVQAGDESLPPHRERLDQYARLIPVSTQGDGVKGFVGLLLMSVVPNRFVTMIDEPETFLHPPQAKLLGRYLSEETPKFGQVIIATHSSHILEGVIDGAVERDVKVIRVSVVPEGDLHNWNVLPAARVSMFWKDPLLRFSYLLDGLFHKGVIICESDSDCRFYTAVLDAFLNKQVEHDLLFSDVGGKARLARALADVKSLGVPVAVIGDIDVLSDIDLVRNLVAAADADPSQILADLRIVHSQVRERVVTPTIGQLKRIVQPLLTRRDHSPISDSELDDIRDVVRAKTGWSEVKRSGLKSLEGNAFIAAKRVLLRLAELGVFLVPVGELERWYPEVPGHGPSHVAEVLESHRYETPPDELSTFLGDIVNYFGTGVS